MRQAHLSLSLILISAAFSIGVAGQLTAPEGKSQVSNRYRIHQGDKLSIKFFNNPDLNEASLIVRPDGFISLQIINEIRAEGLTTAQLRANLEKAYDETLLTPLISVTVIDFVAPHIFISGQVNKPGRYELRDAKTLMQAIFLAGGFTRDANKNMLIHARPNDSGDWTIQSAHAMSILNQKKEQKDMDLEDGDYIFVPESKISQFSRAVETFRGLLPRIF